MKPSSSRRRIAPGDPAAPANHIAIGGGACVCSAGSALFRDCWPAGGVMRALGRIHRNAAHRPSPYLATARACEAAAAVGALALSARDHAARPVRVRRADRQSVLHADHAASNTIFDRHPRVRYGAGGFAPFSVRRPVGGRDRAPTARTSSGKTPWLLCCRTCDRTGRPRSDGVEIAWGCFASRLVRSRSSGEASLPHHAGKPACAKPRGFQELRSRHTQRWKPQTRRRN